MPKVEWRMTRAGLIQTEKARLESPYLHPLNARYISLACFHGKKPEQYAWLGKPPGKYLYHGTNLEGWMKIKDRGFLEPQLTGVRRRGEKGRLYFAGTPGLAVQFALPVIQRRPTLEESLEATRKHRSLIMLAVPVSAVDPSDLFIDTAELPMKGSPGFYIRRQRIPIDKVTAVTLSQEEGERIHRNEQQRLLKGWKPPEDHPNRKPWSFPQTDKEIITVLKRWSP